MVGLELGKGKGCENRGRIMGGEELRLGKRVGNKEVIGEGKG